MKVLQRYAKNIFTIAFNVSVSYCLIVWFSHNVRFDELYADITNITLSSIYLSILVSIVVSACYAIRLKLLLNSRLATAGSLIFIGNGLNNILPFRLGDVLRVYFGRQYYKIEINQTLAATFVERFFDLIALLLMAGLPLLLFSNLDIGVFRYVLIGLVSCATFALLLFKIITKKSGALYELVSRWPFVVKLVDSLAMVSNGRRVQQLFVVTLFLWFSLALQYFVFFRLNLPGVNFGLPEAALLCFITTLSFAIPYMVAGIGVFESAIIYYLVHFLHVPATEAAALALIYHLVFSLPQILLMLCAFAARRVASFRVLLHNSPQP